MRETKWRLSAIWSVLWSVLILGLFLPGARAQQAQPKPNLWPPIDVWGVSGHSFGTIRVAQLVKNGILSHSLSASFIPTGGKTLDALAAELWPGANPKCLHFNWIQIMVKTGNLPLPISAAGIPLNSPFVDPPVGGYQGDPMPADDLPWYLDENSYLPKKTAALNIHNPDFTLPSVLRWYASPYSALLPDAMRYDTVLVLVNDCTSQYEPLGGFHWQEVFPKVGIPYFEVAPFNSKEWFTFGDLVTAFNKEARLKQKATPWTIRPLVKP